MRFPRRAMAEDTFWKLLEVMAGEVDDDALDRLRSALDGRPRSEVIGFDERLARALFELDREELAIQPVRFVDEPDDCEPIPLSDDTFLYLRAAIVAKGHATYTAVLANPALLASGRWDHCEGLLYVASEVIGQEIVTKVSYETGSNRKHWPPRAEPPREPWDQGTRPVVVDCRDLATAIQTEAFLPDGTTAPELFYIQPPYISRDLNNELFMPFVRLIALNGGLPPSLRTDSIWVEMDFGPSWKLEPEISGPVEDTRFFVGQVMKVRVGVAADEVRGWPEDAKRDGLRAVTALALLAALPDDHLARPHIQAMYDVGAQHLP